MAVSINGSLSSSSHCLNYLDGKKSLFLLKKFTVLTELGYKTLDKSELHNTAGELIDIYLRVSHKDSDSIKKELQGLKLVRSSLENYNLKEIFNAALSESTGIDQNSQILDSLNKDQEIHLNQIYTEQLLIWIQEEIEHLPASSVLLLLNIYHGFSDPFICLDKNTWQELLSLKEWKESQKKILSQFKSKYEFLTHFNSLKFPLIKIENTINLVEARGDIKKLKEQYIFWSKLVELLVKSLDEDQKKYFSRSLNKNKKFVKEDGKLPDNQFIGNAKKTIVGFLSKFEQAKKECDEKISNNSISLKQIQAVLKKEDDVLQNTKKKIKDTLQKSLKQFDDEVQLVQNHKNEAEKCLQLAQDAERKWGCFNALGLERQQILHFIEAKNQDLQNASKLREELIKTNQEGILLLENKHQSLETDNKDVNDALILRKQSLLSILSLGKWLFNLLEKENQLMNQLEQEKRVAYEALIKKSESCSKKVLIKVAKQSSTESRSSAESFFMASENASEEEPLISSSSESVLVDSFNEINMYLTQLKNGENTQPNGILSQAVDGFLKPLKAHLLKAKAPVDLKDLQELQIKEIYDHLLIGAAGLELIVQAIHDQRSDHVVLGFRGALIHCYYAIEQTLSQLIILKTNNVLDKADEDHILLHLAQKAKIAEIKKWESFLAEITLHLTFSYPEDYRLFFQQENDLKAFSLLEDLASANLDKEKIKEAVEFCFEMYNKSISFITEVTLVQITDQPKLLHAIQELKQQMIEAVDNPPAKIFAKTVQVIKESDQMLMNRVNQALGILGPLNTYSQLRDQRIYAAIGTVKNYLNLMKISLEIPQNSSNHSLQKFIKIETLANMDKLFKQLFRAVILLESGEDNHQHALINLFALTANFHRKNNQYNINLLKEINLGISHHYLHTRKNKTSLHSLYSKFLVEALSLVTISGEYSIVDKKGKTSAQNLQSNINAINELAIQSFELFVQLLEPTLSEIKERFMINVVV